jgi:hypothetical protein
MTKDAKKVKMTFLSTAVLVAWWALWKSIEFEILAKEWMLRVWD